METITLAAPEVQPQVVTTDYRVSRLTLDVDNSLIIVLLKGTNGEHPEFRYTGAEATALIVALNKANLNPATGGKSLQRRILEKLITDGKLSGTVNGVPD